MRRTLSFLTTLAAAVFSAITTNAAVLLNEIYVNPPATDAAQEYVELMSTTGVDAISDLTVLEVDGDGTAAGVIDSATSLTGLTLGSTGLVFIGGNPTLWTLPAGTTAATNNRFNGTVENGTITFLLVRGFTGAVTNDLDTNDDGTLDSTPWTEIVDSVGWSDGGGTDRIYSPAVLTQGSGTLDAAVRFPGNTDATSTAAWYNGDIFATGAVPDLSTAFETAGDRLSSNFPTPPAFDANGALTPGAANIPNPASSTCGNNVLEGAEECESTGGVFDACCNANTCQFASVATVCRAADGLCDAEETCTGNSATCPADEVLASNTECRSTAGACDVAEVCDGLTKECPADVLASANTECRGSAGACDVVEVCDGNSATCPADQLLVSGVECRGSAGGCDVVEACDGNSATCPADQLVAAGVECRSAVGTCDAAESCTGESGNCPADLPAPNGTACADGNVCTLGDACTAGVCVGGVTDPLCGLDHFTCYKASQEKAPKGQPPFPAFDGAVNVDVVDQFSAWKFDLGKAITLCAPTDKDSGDSSAPTHIAHLEGYSEKLTKTDPPQPKFAKRVVHIENQFTDGPGEPEFLPLTVTGIDRLLVPTAKALGTGGVDPLPNASVDHFQCYDVTVAKAKRGESPLPTFIPVTVTLTDQFGGPLVYELKKPVRLCNPANKENEDPTAPEHPGHLVCYQAKLDKGQDKFSGAVVSTHPQFGPEVLELKSVDELCVPSEKILPDGMFVDE